MAYTPAFRYVEPKQNGTTVDDTPKPRKNGLQQRSAAQVQRHVSRRRPSGQRALLANPPVCLHPRHARREVHSPHRPYVFEAVKRVDEAAHRQNAAAITAVGMHTRRICRTT
jgi:hypothetical protein